jgi:hypothetical protein
MSGPRSKLFIALFAIALNIVGTPMAWARMASMMDHSTAGDPASMEHCAEHTAAHDSGQLPGQTGGHSDCCKDGACSCGFLPSAVAIVLTVESGDIAPDTAEAESTRSVPAKPIDDPLRPPIS